MTRPLLEAQMTERRSLVLSVDDDPADLALLRKLIPRLGYATIEAKDGLQAVELIHERHPDLVLLDGLPIFLSAASGPTADLSSGLEARATDFLAKPVNEVKPTACLRALLPT